MNKDQYGIVAGRRVTHDQLLWQTPVLSLTAQAFLLTIALGSETSFWARLMSASLSFITALASMHLMLKHRYFELQDSQALRKFENDNMAEGFEVVHIQRPSEGEKASFLEHRSAYHLWMITLLAFAAVALTVILMPKIFS